MNGQERVDAARNRRRILVAARLLVDTRGADAVTMGEVADAAGVGKGTLFRRFGDKAGLARALLDDCEWTLLTAVREGSPPLGPGAPPAERLVAFFDAYLGVLGANLDLMRVAETAHPGARYEAAAYRRWHGHVCALLREAGAPVDPTALAHLLLAAVAADLHRALRAEIGPAELRAAALHLVRAAARP